jgi:hypothetical protein
MKKILLLLLIMINLNADFKIIQEKKCQQIASQKIKYDKTDSYHRSCYVAIISRSVNMDGIIQVDTTTTLENIIPMEDVMIYNYRKILSTNIKNTNNIGDNIKRSSILNNCTNDKIRNYLLGERGITLVHTYYQNNGELIISFVINKEVCKNI